MLGSVLDRLLDDEPDNRREQPKSTGQSLRDLKLSVRRDLENLLNTRRRSVGWPSELEELEVSLADYGIPDFTGVNMGARSERERMRLEIERVIRRFEPRLKNVIVSLQDNPDDIERTLRFRIAGVLRTEPVPVSL